MSAERHTTRVLFRNDAIRVVAKVVDFGDRPAL